MDTKDVFMIGLLFILAVEAFAIWLEDRRGRRSDERRQAILEALLAHWAARAPGSADQPVPPGWGEHKPVELTRDSVDDTIVEAVVYQQPHYATVAMLEEDGDRPTWTRLSHGESRNKP